MVQNGSQSNCGLRCSVVGTTGFVVVAGLFLTWIALRFGINAPPGASGDEPSYDSMAWELSQGQGFSIDYTDPEFRAPYNAAAKADADVDSYRLPDINSGPVTFRPPLLSLVGAAGNLVAGRQFYVVRLLNVFLMAATAGLIAWYVCCHTGTTAVIIVLILFVTDVRTRLYARSLLTEPMACLLTTVMTLLLLRFRQTANLRCVAGAGVCCGLGILSRSIVVLWVPVLLLVVCVSRRLQHHRRWFDASAAAALFAGCAVLVVSPWAFRNVILLQRFAPLGTQGASQLSAAYSEIAWQRRGVWQNLNNTKYFQDVAAEGATEIQQEQQLADASTQQAVNWICANPEKLPLLAIMKVASEFRPRTMSEGIVLTLCVVGVLTTLHNPSTWILLGVVLANVVAVALTWSVEGRFLVPQLFCFYTLSGFGIQQILRAIQRPALARHSQSRSADSGS